MRKYRQLLKHLLKIKKWKKKEERNDIENAKKKKFKTLAERINFVNQKDEMWSHQESIQALQKIFPNRMQFP